MIKRALFCLSLVSLIGSCSFAQPLEPSTDSPAVDQSVSVPVERELIRREPSEIEEGLSSAVIGVDVLGNDGAYTFDVTIESLETGCDRYANWWEVITPNGELLYRRILAHPHVNEQPFTRSGGPIPIAADEVAIVRVHMHPDGYSPQAMQGIVGKGLVPERLPADFALELAEAEPQDSSDFCDREENR